MKRMLALPGELHPADVVYGRNRENEPTWLATSPAGEGIVAYGDTPEEAVDMLGRIILHARR